MDQRTPKIIMGPAAGGWVGVLDERMPPTPTSREIAKRLLGDVLLFKLLRARIREKRQRGQVTEARNLEQRGRRAEAKSVWDAYMLLSLDRPAWQPLGAGWRADPDAPNPGGWADGLPWYQPETGDDGSLSWCGLPPEPLPLPPSDETLPVAGPGSIFTLYLRELGGGP